jgi:hypothetical protein
VHAALDLVADPADGAREHRPRLPHRLGHGESEALAQALLDDHAGVALERVHDGGILLDVRRRQERQVHPLAMRVGQAAPGRFHLLEDGGALGIVRHGLHVRTREHELRRRRRLAVEERRVPLEHTDRVLESIPARDLHDEGCVVERRPAQTDHVRAAVDAPR